jgi:O-succinylbenzoic acid--CoA ligase
VSPELNPLLNLENSFDFCAMVPMQVKESLPQLSKIKQLIIGGGVVSSDLHQQLQFINTDCFATYGLTETITHIAVKKLNNFNKVNSNKKDDSYYHTLSNVIISQDDRDCLIIDAPLVSYESITTNDIVKVHSKTQFEWLGRFDNVINSGGIKLNPEIIEEKLSQLIKKRFFVIGVPDDKLGEKLILIIESDVKVRLLKSDFEKCMLTKYEIPKQVFVIDKLVETPTGKIQRKQSIKLI